MAERFELDEDAARRSGERLQTAGRRLVDAHRQLVSTLDSRNGCWGTDSVGKAFEKSYVENADGTSENTGLLAENVESVGVAIEDVTDGFAEVDDTNAREVDSVVADDIEEWGKEE